MKMSSELVMRYLFTRLKEKTFDSNLSRNLLKKKQSVSEGLSPCRVFQNISIGWSVTRAMPAGPLNVLGVMSKSISVKKIYEEKIANAPEENILQNTKCYQDQSFDHNCLIQKLINNDNYLVLLNEEGFYPFKEYPCQITKISSL